MSFDTSIRALARRAVHGLGQRVTLRRVTVGAYSTSSGTVSNTAKDQSLVGRLDEYLDRQIGGTVQAGDRKLILAAVDMTWAPLPKDKVVIADIVHDVVTVKQDMAASLPALYTLQLRPLGG